MELKLTNIIETESIGEDFETTKVEIDESSHGLLLDILFSQMYKNPIGSVCREIASNCYDSHIEAEVDKPIVIKMGYDDGGYYISFIDYGVGLSPERIDKVYRKPLTSTKRNTLNQIGAFGLGSKTPIAYSDSYEIITIYNNIKYHYLFAKKETGHDISTLLVEDTPEGNGTEIKISIKDYQDRNKFIDECKYQLAYFKNIYYVDVPISNDFSIYEAENFLYRADIDKDLDVEAMHLAIGQVMYPIDWSEMGMEEIKIPVGLKFSTSDFIPGQDIIPSRESLRYNSKVCEMIKVKIDLALKEIEAIHITQNQEVETFRDFIEKEDELLTIKIGEHDLRVIPNRVYKEGEWTDSYPFTRLRPKFKGLADLPITLPKNINSMFYFLHINYELNNGKVYREKPANETKKVKRGVKAYLNSDVNFVDLFKNNKYRTFRLADSKNLDKMKDAFIKDAFIVTKNKLNRKEHYRSICTLLKIPKTYLGKAQLIKKYESEMIKMFVACSESYDKLTMPVSFVIEYNNNRRVVRNKILLSNNEISYSILNPVGTSDIQKIKKVKDLSKESVFVLYGFKDEIKKLYFALYILDCRAKTSAHNIRHCNVIVVNKSSVKEFKDLTNIYHVDMFLESKNRIIRDVATAALIESKFNKLLGDKPIKLVGSINTDIGKLYDKLDTFIDKNSLDNSYSAGYRGEVARDLKNELLDLAKRYEFFNQEIINDFNKIETYLKDLTMLQFIDYNTYKNSPLLKNATIQYLKLMKKKLPSHYYLTYRPYELDLIKESEERLKYKVMIDLMKEKVVQIT